jgi:hypothetical protein
MDVSTLDCLLSSTQQTYKVFLFTLQNLKATVTHKLYGLYCLYRPEHFMLVIVGANSVQLLDSLAQKDLIEEIRSFLPVTCTLDFLSAPLQGAQSKSCAYYVLFFAYTVSEHNYKLSDIAKRYHLHPVTDSHSRNNDYLVENFVRQVCYPTLKCG